MMDSIKKYIPNAITTLRLGMAGVFPFLFFANMPVALFTFGVASASDMIDGYLARRWKVESNYGRMIDPIADKLLSGSALILSAFFVNLLLIVPLIMEATIASINFISYKKIRKVDVKRIGKWKTAMLFPTVLVGLGLALHPALVVALLPLMAVTTGLQIATVKEYVNILLPRKAEHETVNNLIQGREHQEESLAENDIVKQYTNINNKPTNIYELTNDDQEKIIIKQKVLK